MKVFLYKVYFFLLSVFPFVANCAEIQKTSVVKIENFSLNYDYTKPWAAPSQNVVQGSGFFIEMEGKVYVMTCAHVVSNSSVVKVSQNNEKYLAKIVSIDHSCDLALLEIKNFDRDKVTPLKFSLDIVQGELIRVYGYPIHGEELSINEGILSRVELMEYCHQGDVVYIAGQIDAAINPGNSGGPVINVDGKVIGLVFSNFADSSNISNVVPSVLIDHFLCDYFYRSAKGFPGGNFHGQTMVSENLRNYYGMKPHHSGIRISHIPSISSLNEVLLVDDIILSVDDIKIDNEGYVNVENKRFHSSHLINQKFIGDKIKVKLLRKGEEVCAEISLMHNNGYFRLVPTFTFDKPPKYYIFYGLLFQNLSADYLKGYWGEYWRYYAMDKFLTLFSEGEKKRIDEEVVVISQVLASEWTHEYSNVNHLVVKKINGQEIYNVKDVSKAFENPRGDFHIIQSDTNFIIAIPVKKALKRNEKILKLHHVNDSFNF